MYIWVHKFMYMYTYICQYLYVCMYLYVYTFLSACLHIYILIFVIVYSTEAAVPNVPGTFNPATPYSGDFITTKEGHRHVIFNHNDFYDPWYQKQKKEPTISLVCRWRTYIYIYICWKYTYLLTRTHARACVYIYILCVQALFDVH